MTLKKRKKKDVNCKKKKKNQFEGMLCGFPYLFFYIIKISDYISIRCMKFVKILIVQLVNTF